jgi:hypothetical protein
MALSEGRPDRRERLVDLGVDEVVLVSSPPADPGNVEVWLAELTQGWML